MRANILYDKGPLPKLNSYQEMVHIIIFEARQTAKILETKTLAQASLGGDKAVEAFNKYRDVLVAPAESSKKRDMQQALDKVSQMGPIRFKPMQDPKTKSLPTVSRKDT